MADLSQHACEHRPVVLLDRPADLAEAERPQRAAMALTLADLAPDLGDADLAHDSFSSFFLRFRFGFSSATGTGSGSATGASGVSETTATAAGAQPTGGSSAGRRAGSGSTSLPCLPRIRATSSGRRSSFSAATVAFAMLIGFVVARLLASTLSTPASY